MPERSIDTSISSIFSKMRRPSEIARRISSAHRSPHQEEIIDAPEHMETFLRVLDQVSHENNMPEGVVRRRVIKDAARQVPLGLVASFALQKYEATQDPHYFNAAIGAAHAILGLPYPTR